MAVGVAPTADAQASEGDNPDLDQIRTLLRAHDEAFTNHDLNGIMACLTEKAAIMGSGPGEVWSGPDEIKVAYEHFFEGFDKGEQKFEYKFKIGGVTSEMGWLMTAGNVSGKKDGKEFTFPLNLSLRSPAFSRVSMSGDKFAFPENFLVARSQGPRSGKIAK